MKHLITLLLVVFSASAFAQTGDDAAASGELVASVQSGAWSDVATWDCACIPGASHDVSILNGHSVSVAGTDTVRAETLGISDGASLSLPADALLEISDALASAGEVQGEGRVVFVGEGPHTCGPATLARLDCGEGDMTLADVVTITKTLHIATADVVTGGLLVLDGEAGITAAGGTLSGGVARRFDWTKTSTYTYQMGSSMTGSMASTFLDQPGAVYAKAWNEASISYTSLVGTDELTNGQGFTCSLPPGTYSYQFDGEAVLQAAIPVTADAANAAWRGWTLASNPLTGYVDLAATVTNGPGSVGTIYQWVDTLETWVAQVGGVGQFGRAGILAPGDAFWTIADSMYNWSFSQECLVDHATWENQSTILPESMLTLELGDGLLVEQCAIVLDGGEETFNRNEDAPFMTAFRGRNNLDIYSQTADSVSVMVNRTSDVAQTIPIWIKAGIGTLLSLEAPDVAENLCLVLEDIETGWTGGIEPGFSYEFSPTDGTDHHRFNLIVGGTLTASSTDAACESAQDGTIAVAGPDLTTSFALVDAAGNPAGTFSGDATSGTFSELAVGTYTVTAITDGCADIVKTVEVSAGGSGAAPFDVVAMPDHIGCYDDHGGVSLDIDGGYAPYTVAWGHGAEGASIEVAEAGVFHAVITDAAGCADSTSVEVLAAPHVTAGAEVDNAVVALIDGEAEVVFTNTSTGATAYQWNFGDGGASTDAAPVYAYTAGGAYTVGLNAWNDYCSDTHQLVVTVEVVSSVGSLSTGTDPILERKANGWSVLHPEESFSLDIFDLTGRQVHRVQGFAGEPVMLDPSVLPVVSLIRWSGEISGRQKTWRLAR